MGSSERKLTDRVVTEWRFDSQQDLMNFTTKHRLRVDVRSEYGAYLETHTVFFDSPTTVQSIIDGLLDLAAKLEPR